jgi:hypothetical protein
MRHSSDGSSQGRAGALRAGAAVVTCAARAIVAASNTVLLPSYGRAVLAARTGRFQVPCPIGHDSPKEDSPFQSFFLSDFPEGFFSDLDSDFDVLSDFDFSDESDLSEPESLSPPDFLDSVLARA